MQKNFYKNRGVALLLGISFSVAIIVTATLISKALVFAQKNSRNIEDYNIAFFAAESGIEEALYYHSFHKMGFECLDGSGCSPEVALLAAPIDGLSNDISRLSYNWDIEGHTNGAGETLEGSMKYQEAVTFYYSYDATGDGNKREDDKTGDIEADAVHTDPAGIAVQFSNADRLAVNYSSAVNPNMGIISFLASYVDNLGAEQKVYTHHDGGPIEVNDAANCTPVTHNGKLVCLNTVVALSGAPVTFTINNTTNAFILPLGPAQTDIQTFFTGADKDWKRMTFMFLNPVPGAGANADLDKIDWTLTIPAALQMTRPVTKITSEGRSRTIVANLEWEIDNTGEYPALDFAAP